MKPAILTTIFLLTLIFTGCTTLNEISFDQLNPSLLSFSNDITRVGVASIKPLEDTKTKVLLSKMDGNMKICCENFAKRIADANYFDKVIICDSVVTIKRDSLNMHEGLNEDEIRKICTGLDVDVLFLFKNLNIEFMEVYSNPNLQFNVLRGIVNPLVEVYKSTGNKPMAHICKSDTLFWELHPDITAQVVIDDISYYVSDKYSEYFVPYWKQTYRTYYDGGTADMRDAGLFVRENNWEEALALWRKIYNQKGRYSAKAAYNIALFYEYKSQPDKSEEWINRAESLSKEGSEENYVIKKYKSELDRKVRNVNVLTRQMNRFN